MIYFFLTQISYKVVRENMYSVTVITLAMFTASSESTISMIIKVFYFTIYHIKSFHFAKPHTSCIQMNRENALMRQITLKRI